jgi:uncharacterized membrane protein YhaH (DUF805 family)
MDWHRLFFSFDGRISRQPYWSGFCLLVATAIACWTIIIGLGGDERAVAIAELALIYPEFAIVLKRANDRETPLPIIIAYFVLEVTLSALGVLGWSGPAGQASGLFWIVFLPWLMIGVYLLVELGFRRGVPGPNRFGPDPLQRQ